MFAVLSALSAAVQLASPPQADYTLRILDPASGRATIAIELSNLPRELTEIEFTLVERFAFTTFPQAQVLDPWVVVLGDAPSEISRSQPFAWRVPCAPGKPLAVLYNAPLTLSNREQADERSDYEMPFVAEDHAMLSTGAFLAAPKLDGVRYRVRIEAPEGWAVHAPWPEVEPGVWAPEDSLALRDALLALGAWRVRESSAAGARVLTLFAPSEERLIDAVAPLVRDITAREFELFGSAPLERYLFLFAPSNVQGFAGSAKHGSMVLSIDANMPTHAVRPHAAHLIAHEFFHTWGAARYACPDELRFFNEGFTDYFAYDVVRRVGASSEAEQLTTLGAKVLEYERAAAQSGLSLVEASGPPFFEGGAAYDQVYAGGLLLAALCEKHLRGRASGLDGFARALNNDERWSRSGAAPTLADFERTLASLAGEDFAEQLCALARTPRADIAGALVAAGCKLGRTTSPAPLELRANFDGLRVTAIDPACAAALIGVQAGDVLVEVNGVVVKNAAESRRAFADLLDGRLRVKLQRADEELTLDAPPPTVERVAFAW